MKQTSDYHFPNFWNVRSVFWSICNFVSFFSGGMNENGQPPMVTMAELLKCASHRCKATVCVKLCSAPGCNKYICISCVENLILKHGLESLNDPDDNLTPILHFCNKKCYRVVMRVINSADYLQIPWNKDGKNGEDDSNNSMALLIKWLTKQGNYE